MFSILLIEDILIVKTYSEREPFYDQNIFKKQYSTATESKGF